MLLTKAAVIRPVGPGGGTCVGTGVGTKIGSTPMDRSRKAHQHDSANGSGDGCAAMLPPAAYACVVADLSNFSPKPRPQSNPTVLIVRLDGLGDCAMTLPLLDQLRQGFAKARIVVLTQPAAEPLFQHSTAVDEVPVSAVPFAAATQAGIRSHCGPPVLLAGAPGPFLRYRYQPTLGSRRFSGYLPLWLDARTDHSGL